MGMLAWMGVVLQQQKKHRVLDHPVNSNINQLYKYWIIDHSISSKINKLYIEIKFSNEGEAAVVTAIELLNGLTVTRKQLL